MCEYCTRHGEGEKWYLQARNYSQDLKAELQKKRVFDFNILHKDMQEWEELKKASYAVRAQKEPVIAARVREMHFGQVLPIEDIERIFDIVNSIVRMECVCRKAKTSKEKRYCYGISVVPRNKDVLEVVTRSRSGFLSGPNTSGLEKMNKEETLKLFHEYEKEGLCHSIWTVLTPFVSTICNCDRADCNAMQETLIKGMSIMYRAEYVAQLNPELCNGCRSCMRVCQFGAIGYSAANKKAYFDTGRCYGCGICRSSCTNGAIKLQPRSTVSTVANLW